MAALVSGIPSSHGLSRYRFESALEGATKHIVDILLLLIF